MDGAKWEGEEGRGAQIGWDRLEGAAAQAWTVPLPLHVIYNESSPPCADHDGGGVHFVCQSLIHSCSLCTISQQVPNSAVMTCFQDQMRTKSFLLGGNNQRVQTEEHSWGDQDQETFHR